MAPRNQIVNKVMSLNLFLFKEKKSSVQKINNFTYDLSQDVFISSPESNIQKINLSLLKTSLSQPRFKKVKNKKFNFLRTSFQTLLHNINKTESNRLILIEFYKKIRNPYLLTKVIKTKQNLFTAVSLCKDLEKLSVSFNSVKFFNLLKQNIKLNPVKLQLKSLTKVILKKKRIMETPKKVQKQKLFYFFFSSILGKKIISYFIKQGKKQQAEKIMYSIFNELLILVRTKKKNQVKFLTLSHSLVTLKRALIFLMPFYEMRSFHMKGQTNTTVLPLYNKRRRIFLIFKLLQNFLKNQKKPYAKRVAEAIYLSSQKEGPLYSLFLKNLKEQRKEYPKVHFRWVR